MLVLTILLSFLLSYSDAELCVDCDAQITPFFGNISLLAVNGNSSVEIGWNLCRFATANLQCYYNCTFSNGTASRNLDYLYSPDVPMEAFTMNEWWKVNCNPGCRMADALACESLTHSESGTCANIDTWRSCVNESLAPYSCDGFCQQSDRWHRAYKLHHEIDCANTTQQCKDDIKSCLQRTLAFTESSSLELSYVMSWEFFYSSGLDKEFRCAIYEQAELCFNSTDTCGGGDDTRKLQHMMNSAYRHYCNDTIDLEEVCTGNDVTTSSSTSTSTTTTFAPTTAGLQVISAPPGTCEYCDEFARLHMQIAALHQHSNSNITEFGEMGCRNYTLAVACYDNCTVGGVDINDIENYTSAIYETIQTQIILSCDETCRHLDLWLCEEKLTTENWCMAPDYNRWLSCYEQGAANQQCEKACGIAQRRVNTYKAARQMTCAMHQIVEDSPACVFAINQCLNTRYSLSPMNFEEFLTANLSSPDTCGYFLLGSQCLNGMINEFGNNTMNISALCTSAQDQEVVREVDGYWTDLYHHEECSSLDAGSTLTYQDICDGALNSNSTTLPASNATSETTTTSGTTTTTSGTTTTTLRTTTATLRTTTSEESGTTDEDTDDSCPADIRAVEECSGYQITECGESFENWTRCLHEEEVFLNCGDSLCTRNKRRAFASYIHSYLTCHLDQSVNDFCWEFVSNECLIGLIGDTDYTRIVDFNESSDVAGLCGLMDNFTACLQNSTDSNVTLTALNMHLNMPCSNQSFAIARTIQMAADAISDGICTDTSLTFEEICSLPGNSSATNNTQGFTNETSTTEEPASSECLNDFNMADILACDASNNIDDCSIGFPLWSSCVESAADDCTGLCTPALRTKFFKTLELGLKCSIPPIDICYSHVDHCFLQAILEGSGLSTIFETTTSQDLCGTMERLHSCLNNTVFGRVEETATDFVVTPCVDFALPITSAISQLSAEMRGLECSDPDSSWVSACPEGHRITQVEQNITRATVTPPVLPSQRYDGLSQRLANYTYDLRGVVDACPTCQSSYSDINNVTCAEISSLLTCLEGCIEEDPYVIEMQLNKITKLQGLVCDAQCPMLESKTCIDQYMDAEGFIACDSVEAYRGCVRSVMSGYECSGLCSEATAFYHQETTFSHSIRCQLNGSCLKAVDEACWNLEKRNNLLRMTEFTTTQSFCRQINDFENCITNSILTSVTISQSLETLQAPCSGDVAIARDLARQFSDSYNTTICGTPASYPWSAVCNSTSLQVSAATTTSIPVPAKEYKVSVQLSLNANYSAVVGSNSEQVKESIKQELVRILGVPADSLRNIKISPGSIKVEFDLITSDATAANTTADQLNSGLPAIAINGESFDTTVSAVSDVSEQAVTTIIASNTTTSGSVTPSGTGCGACRRQLETVTRYELPNTGSKTEYQASVCGELSAAIECFDACADKDNDPEYLTAQRLYPLWCQTDCAFADLATCYATEPKCSSPANNTFLGCLLVDYKPTCNGICTPHQRYALGEKIQRILDCFPADATCSAKVSSCFDTLRDTPTSKGFLKLVDGAEVAGSSRLTDVCSFLTAPWTCLNDIDFTTECSDNADDVQRLQDKWRQSFHRETCLENERVVTFTEKCSAPVTEATATDPSITTTVKSSTAKTTPGKPGPGKPSAGGKEQSSDENSASFTGNSLISIVILSALGLLL